MMAKCSNRISSRKSKTLLQPLHLRMRAHLSSKRNINKLKREIEEQK